MSKPTRFQKGDPRARQLGERGAQVRTARVSDYYDRPLVELMSDPAVFGGLGFGGESWAPWRAFLRALFACDMPETDLALYRAHTGREKPPQGPAREAFAIVGRRAGKSRASALVAVYVACFRDYSKILVPGEKAVILCLAVDREQAAVVLGYIKGILEAVSMLRKLTVRQRRDDIDLRGGVRIAVRTSSYRQVRGYTVAAALCDELAFWWDEGSANPDAEILRALRPGLATVPGSILLCTSTPYARRGEVWRAFDRHYAKDSDTLVWKAASTIMNPTLAQSVVDDALEDDPEGASAEYLAEFRRDVQAFITPEVLEACVVPGRRELPPTAGVSYVAFCDPSGGSQDSMTLAVAHREGEKVVLDCVRERRPPFSPDEVVEEFATVLRSYGVATVRGDRYAGEWPRERFQKHGIRYEPATETKSEIYKAVLPLLNAGRAELLEDRVLRTQLERLERRVARGGRDSVDHGPGGRDDVANAACGALARANDEAGRTRPQVYIDGVPVWRPSEPEERRGVLDPERVRRLPGGAWLPGDGMPPV